MYEEGCRVGEGGGGNFSGSCSGGVSEAGGRMRRSALGSLSPSQINRRVSGVSAPTRVLGKSARLSNVGPSNAGGSKAGLPRRSSMHGKISQPRSDPRSINDRSFQQECIRALTGYLMSHGYNLAISPKLLVAPSSKDILNILQFLFQKVDPNMKFLGKIEEDVPVVFKRLGYPFQISKSALYAAGSPHTWPGLLAALAWLVQLLLHQENAENGEYGVTTFDDNGAKALFEHLSKSYQCFLAGDDDECDRLDAIFKQQFEDSKAQLVEKTEMLMVAKVETNLQALAKEPSPLAALEARKKDFISDKAKFNQINNSLQWHKQAAEKKVEERKQELVAKRAEKEATLAESEELRKRIAAQKINAVEVERMQKEREILEVRIKPAAEKEQQLRKAEWDHEVQASKKFKDLETLSDDFNERCHSLKVSLAEGQLVPGIHHQIKLQPQGNVPEEIRILKPAIVEVRENCKRFISQEKEGANACINQAARGQAARQEKLDQIAGHTAYIKKLEVLYKGQKVKADAAIADKRSEREALEANVVENQLAARMSDAEQDEQVKQWQMEHEAEAASFLKELAFMKMEWLEVVDVILSAKEHINEQVQHLKTETSQTIEIIQQDLSESCRTLTLLTV